MIYARAPKRTNVEMLEDTKAALLLGHELPCLLRAIYGLRQQTAAVYLYASMYNPRVYYSWTKSVRSHGRQCERQSRYYASAWPCHAKAFLHLLNV